MAQVAGRAGRPNPEPVPRTTLDFASVTGINLTLRNSIGTGGQGILLISLELERPLGSTTLSTTDHAEAYP